jgi:hypothetical protein
MVSYEDYAALYDHYQYVVAALGLLLIGVSALWLLFLCLYAKERGRRRDLQVALDRQQSPASQLALIHSFGAAGREELHQIVVEAEQAMASIGGGRGR